MEKLHESFDDFVNEQFNLSGFIDNVKQKTKVDISKYVDQDTDTDLILISIPMSDTKMTLGDVSKIEPLAKKYGKYFKGINVDGDAKKIFIKFMSN